MKPLKVSPEVFAVMRTSHEGDSFIVTLINVTKFKCRIQVSLRDVGGSGGLWRDLLSQKEFTPKKDILSIPLGPYEVLWLTPPT
jgi:hypothetical protein